MEARFTYRCISIWKMQLGRNYTNMLANETVSYAPSAYESFSLSNTFSVISSLEHEKEIINRV